MRGSVWRLVLIGVLAASGLKASGDEPTSGRTTVPTGTYRTALLTLQGGGEKGADLALFLSFRDGRGAAVWFVAPPRQDAHRIWVEDNSLRVDDQRLQGELRGRLVKVWAPIAETGTLQLTVNATIDRGRAAGSYQGRIGATNVSGSLAGAIRDEAEPGSLHSLARGSAWSSYFGDEAGVESPAPSDDSSQYRPQWKAEESLPCMWGKGPEDRYPQRACMTGCTGGASSPVVADGRVFVYYYRPSGSIGAAPLPYGAGAPKAASEADADEFAKRHTSSPLGRQAMIDWYRPFADDVVVAIDAATGKTLWRTELLDRSGNFQAHKWRGLNPTPTVAHGRVYVEGYGGRTYALDASTGALVWEYGALATKFIGKAGGPGGVGPVVAQDVVIVATAGSVVGLDASSGRELWKAPGRHPLLWRRSDGDRAIVFNTEARAFDRVDCLETTTGRRLWSQPAKFWSGMNGSATAAMARVTGDRLLGFAPPADLKAVPTGGAPQAWTLSDSGMQRAWEGEFLPNDENLTVTLGGGQAYVMGREELRAYDPSTGRLLGRLQGSEAFTGLQGPGSNPWLTAVGDRLWLNPEGQHGGQAFLLLDLQLRPLAAWRPPHPTDSAYACMATGSPIVDGRLFVRGHDGLYCYDLRKPE